MASMRTACASWSMRKMYLAVDFFLQRRYRFDSSLRVNCIHRLVTSLVGKYEIAARPFFRASSRADARVSARPSHGGSPSSNAKTSKGGTIGAPKLRRHPATKNIRCPDDAKFTMPNSWPYCVPRLPSGISCNTLWVNSSISIHRTVRAINFFRSSKSLSSHFLL
jgi:hypothetical protein